MKKAEIWILTPVTLLPRWECTDCGVIYPTEEQAACCIVCGINSAESGTNSEAGHKQLKSEEEGTDGS